MKIWGNIFVKLFSAVALYTAFICQAHAIVMNYAIDRTGNIISTSDIRYYNASTNVGGYWGFDDSNNAFFNSSSGWHTLNNGISVTDIEDLTYFDPYGNHAWVSTTNGTNYAIDRNGNIMTSGNIRYYNASTNMGGYWGFNDANNTFYNTFNGGGWQTLNNGIFNVADIVDLTYFDPNGNHAWVSTASGTNYAIGRDGNIILTSDIRYYNASTNVGGYWGFDDSNNTFFNSFTGWQTLNTDLFDVSDILDLTYFDPYGNHAWVAVEIPDAQSSASVPEPGTLALMGVGLAGLGFARRKKAA